MVIDLDTNKYRIVGAKSGDKPAKPVIAQDSVASITTAKILYGLSEGEISGIVGGAKGIYLEDTPLEDDNGNKNFENVVYDSRNGTVDQTYIQGFPDVSNELPVNVELKSTTAWIKAINKPELSAVRIRFSWNGLKAQDLNSGDVSGYKIEYAVDVKTDTGAYVEVLKEDINDKVSGKYERTRRINLPTASTGWQIRVRRITPNQNKENIVDKMYIESITEVIDIKLRYPNTALLGLQYDAKTFSNVAKIAVRAKGKIISIPSNYDTTTGKYIGLWNGTFKEAYSNSPAWIFYDIVTSSRYGLGKRIDKSMLDKWSIYSLGVYCDELIADGEGGLEKRFTCNVYIQSQQDAFKVLQQLSGIFRSLSYWNGEQIVLDADVPKDPIYTFSRANVVDGNFEYSGTRARDRHTVAKVAFDNPNEGFKTEYEYIRDEAGIAKFGINIVDISAFGCTSRAQAQRAGLWALKSEQLETRTVSFKTGLEGFIPQVGNIIEVSDELLAGRANGGRIASVSENHKVITLDKELQVAIDDFIMVNGKDGISQKRKVINVSGRIITVLSPFIDIESGSVYAVRAADLDTMKFRVMTIKPDDNNVFSITALQHESLKYDAIDYGTDVKPTNISNRIPTTISAPESVSISSTSKTVQGQNVTTLIIQWSQVKDAVSYSVEWRRNSGNWIKAPNTGNVSLEVDGVYEGDYLARVTAINAFDVSSLTTSSMLTNIKGKIGNPNPLTHVTAKGVLFGMSVSWGYGAGSEDTNYTEIQVASAPDVNVALLGHFSYPTDNTTVTGLQGGLTLHYRGRVVDKLGNFSEWSTWASGTTVADASLVLDILNGQITESQLFTDLKTKIDKIDTNKTSIDGIKNNLVDTNTIIANAKLDINTNRLNLININQTVGNNKISVDQTLTTLINEDIALNNLHTNFKSEYNNKIASVVQDITTLTNKDVTLSSKLDGVFAQVNPLLIGDSNALIGNDTLNAGVWSEQSARIEEDLALSIRSDNLLSQINDNKASISQNYLTLVDANQATASLITNLNADYNGNKSAIQNQLTVLSNKDTSLSEQITTVESIAGANKSAVQTQATAINGLSASWNLKLDVNGYVSGIGTYNNGTTSQFAINASQFYIVDPNNLTASSPFQVIATANYMENGVVIPKGVYMKDGYIKNASIDLAKINTASISNLSALSANIGHFKSAATGARLEIKDSLLSVYDGNNRLRVRLGIW